MASPWPGRRLHRDQLQPARAWMLENMLRIGPAEPDERPPASRTRADRWALKGMRWWTARRSAGPRDAALGAAGSPPPVATRAAPPLSPVGVPPPQRPPPAMVHPARPSNGSEVPFP
jgi:hypothetical protein